MNVKFKLVLVLIIVMAVLSLSYIFASKIVGEDIATHIVYKYIFKQENAEEEEVQDSLIIGGFTIDKTSEDYKSVMEKINNLNESINTYEPERFDATLESAIENLKNESSSGNNSSSNGSSNNNTSTDTSTNDTVVYEDSLGHKYAKLLVEIKEIINEVKLEYSIASVCYVTDTGLSFSGAIDLEVDDNGVLYIEILSSDDDTTEDLLMNALIKPLLMDVILESVSRYYGNEEGYIEEIVENLTEEDIYNYTIEYGMEVEQRDNGMIIMINMLSPFRALD